MVTSACSCVERGRLRVPKKWNWCVLVDCGGWVVGECLLIPVWGPVRVGFIGKGELGGEWVEIGDNYTKSI